MISLVVTIIVILILASVFIATSSNSPDQAMYARFIQELSNVQDGVYSTRIQNSANGDSEEKINAGFTKVTLEKDKAPTEFESFDFTGNTLVGYIVDLELISYTNAEFGGGYVKYVTEDGSPSDQTLKFRKDDVYVYDASGTVYYVKGLKYNNTYVHSIESSGAGLTSTEDGPIISNITVESGELDDGTKTSAKAKIVISAFPRYGGKLTVLVKNIEAEEQPDGTYVAQVSKNGVYPIIVTEENGGRTVTSVKVSGIVENNRPPENLSIRINDGAAYTNSQLVKIEVRADGAKKMIISKSPLRPSVTSKEWTTYEEVIDEYDLGATQGNITLYAWFIDEYANITDDIVKASIIYDKEPPTTNRPTLTTSGPYVIVEINQTDNVDSIADLEKYFGYRVHTDGEGTEDEYAFRANTSDPTSKTYMIGPLDNGKSYDFKTKAVDGAGNSSISETTTLTVKYDYIIRFDMNGGTSGEFAFDNMYATEGATVTLPTATPVRIGYNFIGWAEKSDENPENTANIFGAGSAYTPTGNIINKTLYAIWTPRTDIPYTVFHYAESATVAGEYEEILREDLQGTAGHMAVAYHKDTSYSNAFEGLVANNSHPGSVPQANILGDGSTVLKLYYNRKQSRLNVIAKNGTATGSSANASYGTIISITSTGNVGYEFDRWYASKDNGNTTLPDTDPVYECFISDNKYADRNTDFKMPAYDITLIANYKIKSYSIKYELNGGTVGEANPTEYNRNTEEFTLHNPTKNGYNFAGWTGTDLTDVTLNVTVNPAGLVNMTDREYIANFVPAEDLLTVTATPNTPTSDVVRVTVTCKDPELTLQYKVGGGAWENYISSIEVRENTTVYVQAIKDGILIDDEEIIISNIDKVKPVIKDIKISDDWEAGSSLKLTITATDNLEVKSALATVTSGEPSKASFGETMQDVEIVGEGPNYIWVSDKAGNVTSEKIYAWDISENTDKKVYAVIIDEGNIEIVGEGNAKAYTNRNTPYESRKTSIKNVTIGEGVTRINDNVLSDMVNVKEITFPTTLTSISEDAISYTNNFENIKIPSSNTSFSYENFTLYDKSKTTIYVHSKADTSLSFEIKESVTEIKKLAFYDNDNLRKIEAKGNPNIGASAFENTSNLVQIEGEIGGTKISENAFLDARALENITLSSTLSEIENGAFKNTVKLANLTIPKGVTIVGKDGARGVFENIGISAGTLEGKGTVRYYQSCTAMKEYAKKYPTEANFVMIDDIAASLVSFEFESPEAGTYPAGTALRFVLTFDEDIDRQVVPLPTLTIKIGSGANIEVRDIKVEAEKVIYTYIVKDTDEGKVQLVSLNGSVHDMVGNETLVSITSELEKDVFIESIIKLEEGVNTYYFTKLQDAINAALNNPETASRITLLKNITESVEVGNAKNINLNLNGKTLTFGDGRDGISNSGILEIGGTGKLVAANYTAIQNAGMLKVNDIELVNDSPNYSIVNLEDAELEVNGTKITTNSTSINNNGALTIDGATITSKTATTILAALGSKTNIVSGNINYSGDMGGAGIEAMSQAKVFINNVNISAPDGNGIINDGNLEAVETVNITAKRNLLNKNVSSIAKLNATNVNDTEVAIRNENGTLTIGGGNITSNVTSSLINMGGTVNISGTTLETKGNSTTIENRGYGKVNIASGEVKGISTTIDAAEGTVTISDGAKIVATSTAVATITNEPNSTLVIKGASVEGNYVAIESTGTLDVDDGTISSTGTCGLKLTGGNVDIDGADILVNSADSAKGIEITGITVNINETHIDVTSNAGNAEGINVKTGILNIENSDILANGIGVQNIGIHNEQGTVRVGVDDKVLDKDAGTIDGQNYGYLGEDMSVLYFYDGKFVGEKDKSVSGGDIGTPDKTYIKSEFAGNRETSYLDSDLDAPTNVTLEADKTTWTNTEITLTGKAEDLDSGVIAYAFTKSLVEPNDDEWEKLDKATASITKTKEVTEYGSYYFYVMDITGNIAVSNVVEAKYDNVAPRITGITLTPGKITSEDVTAIVNAVDPLSGIVGYEFSKTKHEATVEECNFITVEATKVLSKAFIASEAGDWYIYLIDAAGNILYTKQTISNIDKMPPRINVEVENITDDSIRIKIIATDAESIITSIFVNDEVLEFESTDTDGKTEWAYYTITEPGEYIIKANDNAENEVTKLVSAYSVIYDSNNKTGEIKTQIKLQGKDIELKSNPFVIEGYVFDSWNSMPDGSGTRYLPYSAYAKDESTTLYAIWKDVMSPKILDVTISENFVAGNNPLLKITAVDNEEVTGYAVTRINAEPTTWETSSEITVADGDGKYYVWAKDADGNVVMAEVEIYDISKADAPNSTFGIIKKDIENDAKVTLEIAGDGATTSFNSENIPWKDSLDKITDVNVKEGITEIGDGVLANLENAKTIIIQDTVTEISTEALTHTHNFNEILIDGNNFIYENGILLDKDKETLYAAGANTTGSKVTVPSTVTNIAPYAFEENKAAEVVLTQNIDIPEGGFKNAENLVKISTDNGIGGTRISESAFEGATSLEFIDISKDLEYIGDRAFYNATKLNEIVIPESVTKISGENVFTNIGKDAGNPDGKGIVYYYENCEAMVKYATDPATKNQATFIPIDNVKPVIDAFLINSGDEITGDKNIMLTIKATDNHMVSAMIITEDSALVPTATSPEWVAYSESAAYELSSGTGIKTLYLWVKDNSNNICEVRAEDSIMYVEYELEIDGGDTVVQYVDLTGKDYYDYRDRGCTVYGDNVTVTVDDSAVNHNAIGDYEVKYKIIYEGTKEVATSTRKVEVIANDWNTATYTDGKYTFVLHKSKPYAKIVGYQSDNIATELVIPESFTVSGTEYKVIDAGSLSEKKGLSIGGDEVKISKLTLGENMIAVSDYAFSNFTALRELDYGDSLMTIGQYAFSKNIDVGYSNGNQGFNMIAIKSNVREVKANAFRGVGIDSLVIEEGVKAIYGSAFYETIGSEGEVLNIPASIDYIENSAFGGRAVLEINVADDNISYKDIGEKLLISANEEDVLLYAGRRADTELIIPEGVVNITSAAISRATNLVNVTLPSTLNTLLNASFRYDTNLERVTGGLNLTRIGAQSFQDTSLKEFEIPTGVTVIEKRVFMRSKLENVFIHAGVTNISQDAYSAITTLNSFVIVGKPTINAKAFDKSTNLKYLVFLEDTELANISGTTNIPNATKIYVVSKDMENKYENDAIWGTLGADRIKCIAELVGNANVEVNWKEAYSEKGVTLFDEVFSSGNGTSTKIPGFEVTKSRAVDTSVVGTHEVKYTITYKGSTVAELTRKIEVLDTNAAEITDISTSDEWVPGNDLVLTITATDDVDTDGLEYAVTKNPSGDGATWSKDNDVTVNSGTNYIHVKDASGNITTQKIEVWDISKVGTNNVVAYLKEDGEFTACGSGDTKDITRGNAPWKDYRPDITILTIEEGVEGIGEYIFSDLDAVNIINISASSGTTGVYNDKFSENAFAGTNNFDEVNIATGNNSVVLLDDNYTLTSNPEETTIAHSRKDPVTTYVIEKAFGSPIKYIAESAFEKNNNLNKITFAVSGEIGDYAFRECLNLTTIEDEIGNNYIGTGAFSGDINLANIIISKTVTSLGTGIFKGVPGPVYYYASCSAMAEYATKYSTETDFRVIDDVPPTDDAPTLKASSSTIVVTSNQKDVHSSIANVKYAIAEGSGEEGALQELSYFTGLKADTYYTVRTFATDAYGNTAYSKPATIKTAKVPDAIDITASPTTPVKGNVTVTIEWPETIIDELYGGDWPEGTDVVKQIGIKHSGDANITWSNASQDVASEDITVTENKTTVYARLYDGKNYTAGTISLTIENIDRIKPTGTVVINSGDESTFDTSIKLGLTATDNSESQGYGVKYYYASAEPTVPSSDRTKVAWKAYSGDGVYDFEITETRGEKKVYVWFMDYAGNVSDTYSDTITLLANGVRLEQNGTTTYYDKLSDAVDAAIDTSPAVASRITLLKNITGEKSLYISSDKNIIIDMNGFNIVYTSDFGGAYIKNEGKLRIENTKPMKETSIYVVVTDGSATGVINVGVTDVDGVSIKVESPNGVATGILNTSDHGVLR